MTDCKITKDLFFPSSPHPFHFPAYRVYGLRQKMLLEGPTVMGSKRLACAPRRVLSYCGLDDITWLTDEKLIEPMFGGSPIAFCFFLTSCLRALTVYKTNKQPVKRPWPDNKQYDWVKACLWMMFSLYIIGSAVETNIPSRYKQERYDYFLVLITRDYQLCLR